MIFAIMRNANTNKRGDGMYDTTIAAKLLSQLESFSGRISPQKIGEPPKIEFGLKKKMHLLYFG